MVRLVEMVMRNGVRIYKEYESDIIAFSYRIEPNERRCENYYEEGLYGKNKIKENIIPTMMYNT